MNRSNELDAALRRWAAQRAAQWAAQRAADGLADGLELQRLRQRLLRDLRSEPPSGSNRDERLDEDHDDELDEKLDKELDEKLDKELDEKLEKRLLPANPLPTRQPRWQRRVVWYAFGGGAAVLLLCVAQAPWRDSDSPRASDPSDPLRASQLPEFARLGPSQLTDKQRLFVEMERVFDGQVAWIAERGGRVRIGVAPDDGFPSVDSRRLVIRLVATRTSPESPQPVPVWTLDLLSANEQFVRLDDAVGGDKSTVDLWAYCLPNENKVVVDAALDLGGAAPLRTNYSRLQVPGTPQLVCTWDANAARYHMYQTVDFLDGEAL